LKEQIYNVSYIRSKEYDGVRENERNEKEAQRALRAERDSRRTEGKGYYEFRRPQANPC
jgi:hypothetical protein